jgi:hypothetical protein
MIEIVFLDLEGNAHSDNRKDDVFVDLWEVKVDLFAKRYFLP